MGLLLLLLSLLLTASSCPSSIHLPLLSPTLSLMRINISLFLLIPCYCPCRELLTAMLEDVSSEYVLLAVHGIGYLAR